MRPAHGQFQDGDLVAHSQIIHRILYIVETGPICHDAPFAVPDHFIVLIPVGDLGSLTESFQQHLV